MREVFAGIILLFVIGVAGFLYRNEVEHGTAPAIGTTTASTACTADARICPDGTAVGRTGSTCAFAVCALPNVELDSASSSLSFVLAPGYVQKDATPERTVLRSFEKPTSAVGTANTLTISQYPIEGDTTAALLMLENTVFDPSGIQATSTDVFKQVTYGKNTFYVVTVGRFEGQVETEYYLPVAGDTSRTLYRFDLVESNVTNWTDPNLNSDTLPEHRALQQLLATVQVTSQ